jgi:saccharopine dehydrogenase-like NADP-dependent oxidoreductase
MKLYGIADAATFIRTTLRYPAYCFAWHSLVNAGLTDEHKHVDSSVGTFREWSRNILQFVHELNKKQLDYLGIFQDKKIPGHLKTSADILQFLLEEKLMMKPTDKDMIVMFHEVEYFLGNNLFKTDSLLVVKGIDSINTAMATTVGLPLGIAACLILQGKISLTGLRIPVDPEICQPVLTELEAMGIHFDENSSIL